MPEPRGRPRVVAAALLGCALAASAPAPPQDTAAANDPRVRDVAGRLACYCGCNTQSIAECTCGVARQSRGEILDSLDAGASTDEVVAAWVERFGPRILLEPPRRGFALLGWFLPGGVLILAAAFLLLMVRRWSHRQAQTVTGPGDAAPPDPRYLERLQRDLERMDR